MSQSGHALYSGKCIQNHSQQLDNKHLFYLFFLFINITVSLDHNLQTFLKTIVIGIEFVCIAYLNIDITDPTVELVMSPKYRYG